MTSQMTRRIRERWEEISGVLTLAAKRRFQHSLALEQVAVWRRVHAVRVGILLGHGVRLRKIRLHGWDDPRVTESEFTENLHRAIDNLVKRNRTIPPLGLARMLPNPVPSDSHSKGETDD